MNTLKTILATTMIMMSLNSNATFTEQNITGLKEFRNAQVSLETTVTQEEHKKYLINNYMNTAMFYARETGIIDEFPVRGNIYQGYYRCGLYGDTTNVRLNEQNRLINTNSSNTVCLYTPITFYY